MFESVQRSWYEKSRMTLFLIPITWIFCNIVMLRSLFYRFGILRSYKLTIPVIIVGNISIGGNGKTPTVIWLANFLKQSGYRPGIISRGYGGKARKWPQQVRPDSDPVIVGDEAIVISRRTNCPMAVGPERVDTGNALIAHSKCDIIISDDGLQHYKLKRDIEVAVIDGQRRHGNGYCLPAGPLRESIKRLDSVDFILTNGDACENEFSMNYIGDKLYSINNDSIEIQLQELQFDTVHAVAGIAHPERFFNTLKEYSFTVIEHSFPDHYYFTKNDLLFNDNYPILMTEKDAVKCRRFTIDNCWYLPIEIVMSEKFGLSVLNKLEKNNG